MEEETEAQRQNGTVLQGDIEVGGGTLSLALP